MTALAAVLATVVATLLAVASPILLRRSRVPDDEPADIFVSLATRRFAGSVGCVAAAAVLVVMITIGTWPPRLPWLVLATIGPLLAGIESPTDYPSFVGGVPDERSFGFASLGLHACVTQLFSRRQSIPSLRVSAGAFAALVLWWR